MDYVVGSVAALITGNVTPNRPKHVRRALTPVKHQLSPEVTPRSEQVEDRSIFLSPTLQKKKAIVKKSPKRIFENTDFDGPLKEGDNNLTSPKAEKVKKHLEDNLGCDDMKVKTPNNKKSPKKESTSVETLKKSNILKALSTDINLQNVNENTPKKKKKQNNPEIKVNGTPKSDGIKQPATPVASEVAITPGKQKKRKSNAGTNEVATPVVNNAGDVTSPKKQKTQNTQTPKKEVLSPAADNSVTSPKKQKKRKAKTPKKEVLPFAADNAVTSPNKQKKQNAQTPNKELLAAPAAVIAVSSTEKKKKKRNRKKNKKGQQNSAPQLETPKTPQVKQKKKGKPLVNPKAITDKDSDSEHESDNEIDSDDEEMAEQDLDSEELELNSDLELDSEDLEINSDDAEDDSDDEEDGSNNAKDGSDDAEDSSDEEEEQKPAPKKSKKEKAPKEKPSEPAETQEQESQRTVFVGNVPFHKKLKRDMKALFVKHGQVESVRIRTVPVKDGSVTPKVAVIKNELHPDRNTVNVYVKFKSPESARKALAENNTVYQENHIRVTVCDNAAIDHDPSKAIFVGNLPFTIEDEELRGIFVKCGPIESIRIIRDRKTNAGKGFGFINFESKDGVELALALTDEDLSLKTRIIRVKRCTPNAPRKVNPNQKKPHGKNPQQPQKNFSNKKGAELRLKRKMQGLDGAPPSKIAKNTSQPPQQPTKEKKQKKEFVGMTAEKKKKPKNNKGQKKKQALSEILTK